MSMQWGVGRYRRTSGSIGGVIHERHLREKSPGCGSCNVVDRPDPDGVHHASVAHLSRRDVHSPDVATDHVGARRRLALRPERLVLGRRGAEDFRLAPDPYGTLADAVGEAVAKGGAAGDEMTIHAIIETAVYVDDLAATEAFYHDLLGLPVIGKEPGRHVFFRVGERN